MEVQVVRRKKINSLLIAILFGGFLIALPVMAAGEGSQSGGGGQSGCGGVGWTIDTCYGAVWRWYPWPEGAEEVQILGNYSNASYAHSATIKGQACKDAGGYWRYGMVAYNSGTLSDGKTKYSKGDQVGVIGISGNQSNTYNTVFWGGGMNYIGSRDDFDAIGKIYNEYKKKYPTELTLGWESGSALAWFCGGKDQTPPPPSGGPKDLYSSSHVSNRSTSTAQSNVNDWKTTGIKNTATTVNSSASDVCINDTLNITFSHNAYASQSKSGISWEVKRTATINGTVRNGFSGSGYTVSMPGDSINSWNSVAASQSGTMDITQDRGSETPKYIAQGTGAGTSRPKSDGTDWYVSRDFYEVKFSTAGTYKFCETFYANGAAITTACSDITVKSCGGPNDTPGDCGQWTPSSYTSSTETSGTSSVVSKVKNTTINTDWEDTVYAKPRDQINWIHCYYPGAQMVAFTDATDYHGAHDHDLGSGGTTANTYDSVSNLYSSWSNYLKVTAYQFSRTPNPETTTYSIGDYNGQKMENQYSVEYGSGKNKAGKTLQEKGQSGYPSRASVTNNGKHSWSCNYGTSCSSCGSTCDSRDEEGNCTSSHCNSCYRSTCHHSNDYISYSAYNYAYDNAYVKVPYNFNNSASIELKDTVVFAGETSEIKNLVVTVGTRSNATTNGTYATNVNSARIKIISYTSSSNAGSAQASVGSGTDYNICNALSGYTACNEIASKSGITLNSSGNLDGDTMTNSSLVPSTGRTYNVYDVPAGRYYCVVLAVYPANSGSDTMMTTTGSDSWYVSAPSCAKVAKKPSLQVWGSGMYTSGRVVLSNAVKHIVSGKLNDFNGRASSNITFGSWVEQNVVANAQVNIASGAATGLAGSTARTYNGVNGYYTDTSASVMCLVSPLTMPNSKCSTAYNPGGNSGSMVSPKDKEALIARFTDDEDDSFSLYNGTCTLSAAPSFDTVKTHVYKCDSTFTINGNIEALNGTYSALTDIPKVIIYANNINITSNVTRIDAVLIAKNTVDTSSDGGAVNSQARSKQLKINGTVITNKLLAKRTYGTATGTNSGVPAEVIDYDTSVYLWGAPRADVSGSGKLESVYQTELAPRY